MEDQMHSEISSKEPTVSEEDALSDLYVASKSLADHVLDYIEKRPITAQYLEPFVVQALFDVGVALDRAENAMGIQADQEEN